MRSPRLLVFSLVSGILLLAGCGAAGTETRPADTGGTAPADRSTSATYVKFFEDVGNSASGAKWSISNSSGAKQFGLSSTYYSSPKAWVIGQNYWNGENDRLTSVGFTIPAQTAGIVFAFYSRWQIASGDYARVDYSADNGGSWVQLQAFTNGSNAAWPNWTKYSYALPSNMTASAKTYRVRFRFTSNSAGTGWGFGADSISVYQRQLSAPQNLSATDELDEIIIIDWQHAADAGGHSPEYYDLYRSTNGGNSYEFYASVAYPETFFSEYFPGGGGPYHYKVAARKTGYPLSAFSNSDSGFAHD
jgi:hypothetical protein